MQNTKIITDISYVYNAIGVTMDKSTFDSFLLDPNGEPSQIHFKQKPSPRGTLKVQIKYIKVKPVEPRKVAYQDPRTHRRSLMSVVGEEEEYNFSLKVNDFDPEDLSSKHCARQYIVEEFQRLLPDSKVITLGDLLYTINPPLRTTNGLDCLHDTQKQRKNMKEIKQNTNFIRDLSGKKVRLLKEPSFYPYRRSPNFKGGGIARVLGSNARMQKAYTLDGILIDTFYDVKFELESLSGEPLLGVFQLEDFEVLED